MSEGRIPKVHITGGRGFLGRYIQRALASHYQVEVTDRNTLDVRDLEALVVAFRRSMPDLVCHLAALTGAQASARAPHEYFTTNTVGTLNVLEACRLVGVPRFLFMSSVTVHGSTGDGVVREDSPLSPRHPYGGSKAAAEILVETYARTYGIQSVILRGTLVSGEGQAEPNSITEFIGLARSNGEIRLLGDGSHSREWLHSDDVAEAVRAAVERSLLGLDEPVERFVISSGEPVSMRRLAERVVAIIGAGRLTYAPPTGQAFSLVTDPSKAKAVLGWVPQVGLDEIIRRVNADMSSSGKI